MARTSFHLSIVVKNLPGNAEDIRDAGWIAESGRSLLEEGMATPLTYTA